MLKLYAGISERDDMEKRQSFWLKHLIAFSLVIMNNWLWWSTVHNSFTLCMFYRETVLLASIFSGQFQCNLPMVNVLLNTAAFALYHLEIHFIISFQYFMNILVITVKAGWVFLFMKVHWEDFFFVICHGSSIKRIWGDSSCCRRVVQLSHVETPYKAYTVICSSSFPPSPTVCFGCLLPATSTL